MPPKKSTINEVPGDLWEIVTKLRGLAALFRMADGETPVDEESFHGISFLLAEIADDADRVRDLVEYGPR